DLRVLLDAPLRELAGARLDRDLVDRADPGQPLLERQLEAGRKGGGLRHGSSLVPVAGPTPVAALVPVDDTKILPNADEAGARPSYPGLTPLVGSGKEEQPMNVNVGAPA